MTTVKAVAATGQLGTGFRSASLDTACEGADFIACDAGSTDPGPHYLGSGSTQASAAAVRNDLARILRQAATRAVPALIGSAGTAGGRPHLAATETVLRAAAREVGATLPFATIGTELSAETVARALRRGQLRPLANAPQISEESIFSAVRIVALIGPEPFQEALAMGAQVVLAGRSSDTSLYVAVPRQRGIPDAVAYHAAKVLECGAACARERPYPDSMVATMEVDGFTVEPPNPELACTPQSVAAHTLYENADPFLLVEPGGTLDTTRATFTAVTDRAVHVAGSAFVPSDDYTVRLEAARLAGFRTLMIAGIRDPLVLAQLDDFIASASERIHTKIGDDLQVARGSYVLRWIVYGRDGTMGRLEPTPQVAGHEVGVLIDVVAATQELASAIGAIAWHTALHHPIKEYSGLVSNLAFPMSPPAVDAGAVYEFALNHVMVVDDPLDVCTIELSDL